MIHCIICGRKTKHPSFDYCEECFNTSIEEIEKRYSNKKGLRDPRRSTGDPQGERTFASLPNHTNFYHEKGD
jgi:hypothetical protein